MLAVVCCHLVWPTLTGSFDWVDRVLVNGWIGVDLFFVLSGFLITGILIDARGAPRYFRTFYARRALRIFPIYYLFLVAVYIWVPFWSWLTFHGESGPYVQAASHQSWYWTYTVNILQARSSISDWWYTGHLWSLSVEEQFYLVWPAVVLVVPRRRLPVLCLAAMALAVMLRFWWAATHQRMLGAYVLTPLRVDSLAVGALVASLARTGDGTALLRRWYRRVGLVALAVALPVQVWFGSNLQDRWVVLVGYAANAVVFAALIVWVLDDARPRRRLEFPGLRRIGRISYGGYLYHLPLIGACAALRLRLVSFAGNGTGAVLVAHALWIGSVIALTILVASISYRWIETPFLDAKDRLWLEPPLPSAAGADGRRFSASGPHAPSPQ